MNYAALQALEDQAELVREYGNHYKGERSSIMAHFPKEHSGRIAGTLQMASPLYLAPDIQDMLDSAMETLPDTIPLRREDIPMPAGFLKLGKTLHRQLSGLVLEGSMDHVSHLAWYTVEEGVSIYVFGKAQRVGNTSPFQYLNAIPWLFGEAIDNDRYASAFAEQYRDSIIQHHIYSGGKNEPALTVETDSEELAVNTYLQRIALFRWMYAIWHFMAQKVSAKERHYPDRAMQRRLQIEKTEKFVDIITLRAAEKKHEQDVREEATRHVSVRFWVRAHWRKQWYPSEGVNKPLWISSYVKGPEGAKFVGPTKLFAVSR